LTNHNIAFLHCQVKLQKKIKNLYSSVVLIA